MTTNRDAWADWVTIWQSELAAMAADREVQETIQRGIDLWAAHASVLRPPQDQHEAGSAGAVAPPGPAPAVAAPGDRERADVGPSRD